MRNIITVINEIESKIKSSPNIGLFLSGGFDSTTLAYTVLDIISKNNYESKIVYYTVPRYDDSELHSNRIVRWLNSRYSINTNIKIVGDPDLHHSQQVISGIKECLKEDSTVTLFLGDTKNPDDLPNGPIRIVSKYDYIYQPFIEYDKTITLQIANHFNIINDVSLISHTCTESKKIRCNKCWQCKERIWAFNKLNYIDVGLM